MATRAVVEFRWNDEEWVNQVGEVAALVYVHNDGYPTGLGLDLLDFLDDTGKLRDTRFHDPSYLAAKFVVHRALSGEMPKDMTDALNFLGVGVVQEAPGDIEYVHTVVCTPRASVRPRVYWRRCREDVSAMRETTREMAEAEDD